MASFLDCLQGARVEWKTTDESPYVFQAVFQGKTVKLRMNDFPDEPLCTVTIDECESDLHEFSPHWILPRPR